jgi:hypothetical protein
MYNAILRDLRVPSGFVMSRRSVQGTVNALKT